MIIKLCFLSGEIHEMEVPDTISRIYNAKCLLCDKLYIENGEEREPSLVHFYKYNNEENEKENENENENEIDDTSIVNDGEMYRVVIENYECYVIYLRNDQIYRRKKEDKKSVNDEMLSREDISSLVETKSVQYYFDLKTFQKSWFNGNVFFSSYGYSLESLESLINENHDNDQYVVVYRDEWNAIEVFSYTKQCLSCIFRTIQNITDIELINECERNEKVKNEMRSF
jgi:hypothetical protein